MNTTSVDAYLKDGCGRCEHYQTPQCKVHLWTKPLGMLRELVRGAELGEEMKWGNPTYTLGGKNVAMLVSLREYCALAFFKGSLLEDGDGVLESPGPNSHHMRQLRFRSADEVKKARPRIQALLAQAIQLEKAGRKVERAATPREPMPEELQRRLAGDAALKEAFDALTPGRQRSHVLHVSGAKQAETRERRVDKCVPVILAGRGFNER
jgi:uncharacterized protein YdeI (YjbR/CyaY-like superfamily)